MTTDAPQWRPLSDAPSIIGAVSAGLAPNAQRQALSVALASGPVLVRGQSLSRPLQQPIQDLLVGGQVDVDAAHRNELRGRRGNDRLDFWGVEIDQTSLTQYVREFLAPAAPLAPEEPGSVAATVASRWRDKFQVPEFEVDLTRTPNKPGRKSMREEIHDALDDLKQKEPNWPFDNVKGDLQKTMNSGGKHWNYKTFSRHRASWKAASP